MPEWLKLETEITQQVGRPYAEFVARQQHLNGLKINEVLGGSHVPPQFFNQELPSKLFK